MVDHLVRKHLRSFVPYTSARSEVENGKVLLDANELSLGSAVTLDGIALNRYPDPNQMVLRARLANTLGIPPQMVFVGSGSDEIIDLLVRLFCEPGLDSVAVVEPTYGVYRVAANISGVEACGIDLDVNFQLDVPGTLQRLKPTTKIIFLCSPNNPTGNLLKKNDIVDLCRQTRAVVVVDQAYLEFADPSGDASREVLQYPNLVVLRTLSKAWGLAGIRLGYCVADPSVVSYLLRIKAPYNINAVTSTLALRALGNPGFLATATSTVVRERVRLDRALQRLPDVKRVFPSDANFLLVEFPDAGKVYGKLASRGIMVRRRSEPRLRDCLRITVGTEAENECVLETLRERS